MTDIQLNKGRQPDFKGDGVAVWVNQTKDNKQYLSINLLQGSIKVAAWKNEPETTQASPGNALESTEDEAVVTYEKAPASTLSQQTPKSI